MNQDTRNKRCFLQFGITLLVVLFVIAVFNIIIDPFFHYHAPCDNISNYVSEQMYQTPGMINHFAYDSAVIGTSMTENFRSSWFKEKEYNTIKLSYSGGRTKDMRTIYDMIFEKNTNLKFVWTDIEAYQLLVEPESRGRELPEYIYNNNPIDDVGYVWNGDVFWYSAQRVIETIKGVQHDIDDAYTWEDPALFSKRKVLEAYWTDFEKYREEEANIVVDNNVVQDNINKCQNNLDNILPVIEKHPETEFVFFFPPYSAIYWHRIKLQKEDWILDVNKYAAKQLIMYPNVKIYYFQDEFDWITDIDSYRDECHHNPQINHMIFDKIFNDEKRLTSDNVDKYFDDMRVWLNTYDFEYIWNSLEEE